MPSVEGASSGAGFSTTPSIIPNSPARTLVYSQDGGSVDSHGTTLMKHGLYLWVADRFANKVVVVNTRTDSVVGEFSLAGDISPDPAPDLMGIAPSGNRVFVALRGPRPLSGNNPAFNNAVGSTPGLGVIQVTQEGRSGELIAVAPISTPVYVAMIRPDAADTISAASPAISATRSSASRPPTNFWSTSAPGGRPTS